MDWFTPSGTKVDLESCVTLPEHVWVHSGRCAVSPLDRTTLGVGGFHAPPYTAGQMRLTFELEVDGMTLRDSPSGFRLPEVRGVGPREARALLLRSRHWQIDRITRSGHGHFRHDRGWTSLLVESELVPLHDDAAFALRATITNRGSEAIVVRPVPKLEQGVVGILPLSKWEWSQPRVEVSDASVFLRIDRDELTIKRGACESFVVTVAFHEGNVSTDVRAVERRWATRMQSAAEGLPRFESDHRQLSDYVQRCLITGMTCLWEAPGFAMNPHMSTSGIDGRAICSYIWDMSYAPLVMRMMFPSVLPAALAIWQKVDIGNHFAFTADGQGTGPWYSANDTALTDIVWALACVDGPDIKWTSYLRDVLLASEGRLPALGALRDFGNNHNLLEMRTNGYEHFVPCMNSQRSHNLERLATLCELTGAHDPTPLRQMAKAIARDVQRNLWNEREGWFDCVHPDGSRHRVDSIQVFDVMTAGVATKAQQRRLVERVADGDFLAPYGVQSVSPVDERHFELVDVDWSGNGAFVGEPQQLVQTLWQNGFAEKAWQVLERLLWMGTLLPYLPQETHAQRPSASPRGVANQCAALAGVQAVWCGMFGVNMRPSGELYVHPRVPRGVEASLSGLRFRGRTIDIRAHGNRYDISVDGKVITNHDPKVAIVGT